MKAENILLPHYAPVSTALGAFSLWRENSSGLFNPSTDNVAAGCSLNTLNTIIPLSVQLRSTEASVCFLSIALLLFAAPPCEKRLVSASVPVHSRPG